MTCPDRAWLALALVLDLDDLDPADLAGHGDVRAPSACWSRPTMSMIRTSFCG
jgi:hypothetical protein